jgi:Mn-dependent DtxR family transcriptional regulator
VEGLAVSKHTISVTIDLRLLALRLRETGKRFIHVHEMAYELGVSSKTAGKILKGLARLGYAIRWSDGVYMILDDRRLRFRMEGRVGENPKSL